VRDPVERRVDAGITTPILVPASAHSNQMRAFAELFGTYA